MKNGNRVRHLALLGCLLTFALVLSFVESLIPIPFAVPGMKLGLANLAVVVVLDLMGWREALTVNLLRILLAGLLFGSLFGILFGASGAIISFMVMTLLHGSGRFSLRGVSMAGGVSHNVGQLIVAAFTVHTAGVLYYAPVLLITGLVTGYLIGVIATAVCPLVQGAMDQWSA